MKKIIVLLLVIFSFFTTFVSAQDTVKSVTFNTEKITVLKDDVAVQKNGKFELVFSTQPGIIFFRDLDKLTLMKIIIGEHVLDQDLNVCYKGELVSATAMCFNGTVNDMDIIFSTVLLNDKEKTVYAFGITLSNYSILIKVIKE